MFYNEHPRFYFQSGGFLVRGSDNVIKIMFPVSHLQLLAGFYIFFLILSICTYSRSIITIVIYLHTKTDLLINNKHNQLTQHYYQHYSYHFFHKTRIIYLYRYHHFYSHSAIFPISFTSSLTR